MPIFYDFSIVPQKYSDLYSFNPVAAVVLILRTILLDGKSPAASTLLKLTFCTSLVFGAGLLIFGKLKRKLYDYLL